MKYYIVVKNTNGENLAVFKNFEDVVKYCENKTATIISSFRIQLIPEEGV
jgi:hypothetical protein